jgi:hypothetical protein
MEIGSVEDALGIILKIELLNKANEIQKSIGDEDPE